MNPMQAKPGNAMWANPQVAAISGTHTHAHTDLHTHTHTRKHTHGADRRKDQNGSSSERGHGYDFSQLSLHAGVCVAISPYRLLNGHLPDFRRGSSPWCHLRVMGGAGEAGVGMFPHLLVAVNSGFQKQCRELHPRVSSGKRERGNCS